jgi:aspartyl aminopeptidase
VPQFAMHSIRELAAVGDVKTLYSLNERFLNAEKVVLD